MDKNTSPFNKRFDVEQMKKFWRERGDASPEQAHRFGLDLYEIDECCETMFMALRHRIVPAMETNNVEEAIDGLIQYQITLEHLNWHAEEFLKAVESWIESLPDDEPENAA